LKPGVVVTMPSLNDALVELRAFLQHGGCRLQAGVLEAGDLRDLVDARQMLDGEQHVLDGGGVAHGIDSNSNTVLTG